jgi:hypothetical protein
LAELAGIWCLALQRASCRVVGSRGVRASNMEREAIEKLIQESANKGGSISVVNQAGEKIAAYGLATANLVDVLVERLAAESEPCTLVHDGGSHMEGLDPNVIWQVELPCPAFQCGQMLHGGVEKKKDGWPIVAHAEPICEKFTQHHKSGKNIVDFLDWALKHHKSKGRIKFLD